MVITVPSLRMKIVWVLLLACTCAISYTSAESTGAPNGACDSMQPSHGVSAQSGTAPFQVVVTKQSDGQVPTEYAVGVKFKVVIKPNAGQKYKGILLKARRADSTLNQRESIGKFTPIANTKNECSGAMGNAVTHSNAASHQFDGPIEFIWEPDTVDGHIEFVATVVEIRTKFWTNIKSGQISDPNAGAIGPGLQVGTDTGGNIALSGAGSTKGVFSLPNDCSGSDCQSIVTWKKTGGAYEFEMSSDTDYVALGFSTDKKMGNDIVIACVKKTISGQVKVEPQNSLNTGQSNAATSHLGITAAVSKSENGKIQCRFTHDAKTLDQLFYYFLASGKVVGEVKQQHTKLPEISDDQHKLSQYKRVTSSQSKPWLIKVHGALMMIAWVTFASIGIMMARYYKEVWPGSTLCAQKVWFSIHRACMITVFLLTVIATGLIFGHVEKFSDLDTVTPKILRAHPITGLIVVGLTVLNPIMAVFRPHPTAANRPIFNWAHWGVGTLAHIVAMATILMGLQLPSAEPVVPDWLLWVMVGFICFHFLFDLIMEVHKCNANNAAGKSNSMEMSPSNDQNGPQRTPGSFRPIMFMIFVVVVAGVGATLAIVVLAQ